nr:unnamed protein product [Digitaria exilis]
MWARSAGKEEEEEGAWWGGAFGPARWAGGQPGADGFPYPTRSTQDKRRRRATCGRNRRVAETLAGFAVSSPFP